MRIASAFTLLAALLIGAASPAEASEPEPGKTVTLACRADASHRYACYLPKAYDPAKEWPILYCFAPDAQGDALLGMFRETLEERGWIGVGSLVVKGGDRAPNLVALDKLWADTEARLSLSPRSRFAGGFSAGARISFLLVEKHPEALAGVIAVGAGTPKDKGLPGKELAVFLCCGETDFNRKEMEALASGLSQAGNPHRFETFPGGHQMPGGELLAKAVGWLDEKIPEKRAARVEAGLAAAGKLAEDGKAAEAVRGLADLLDAMADDAGHREAIARLVKKLAKEPGAKDEAAALSRYDGALAFVIENGDRLADSRTVRGKAEKKLADVVKRYPGTRAAELAKRRLEGLPKGRAR